MARLPVFTVVDAATLTINSTSFFEEFPEEWKALLEWCRLHGMVPEEIPIRQTIVRNFKRARVEYDEFVIIDGCRVQDLREPSGLQIHRVHAQGETPPMPFPDVILAHLNNQEPSDA